VSSVVVDNADPRGSPQNRPLRVTSKPANEADPEHIILYLTGEASGNPFALRPGTAGIGGAAPVRWQPSPSLRRRPSRLWECGNLAPSARFPRSGGSGGKAAVGLFHGFHGSVISTAGRVTKWRGSPPRLVLSRLGLSREWRRSWCANCAGCT
jgi:hypothetical protein